MRVTFSVTEHAHYEGIVVPKLSHGDRIVQVTSVDDDVENCDAVITMNSALALGIRTADCAPICFSDGEKIGISHVGWRGLCLGLIEKMLSEFDAECLEVFVGPRLDIFEIQKDSCYEAIVKKFGENFFTITDQKIIFHFKDAITSCLPPQTILDARNTGEDMTLPSHRRDRTTKRILTVVQFK